MWNKTEKEKEKKKKRKFKTMKCTKHFQFNQFVWTTNKPQRWTTLVREWKARIPFNSNELKVKKNMTSRKGAIIGQFTRLLRSLELRAVSHCTVLLLWDQKLLLRMRDCFEGSKIHLPTLWLDAVDACMTRLQRKLQVCSATISERLFNAFLLSIMRLTCDLKTSTHKPIRAKERKWMRKKRERSSRTY